jgi:hypothetical protein
VCISIYVDPTLEGIPPSNILEDSTQDALEAVDEDSEPDENVEILEMEKRDFDDVVGIEPEVK